ncbi:trypsin-1-like [Copidosoma floridanum]|uniref:trypsin-1-like n=1 Tax=Copidosoma floridanum TaxID=29053 RepID=UPI0006C9AC5B|nr:trypsin-1-like [Copidosoma floridanum]
MKLTIGTLLAFFLIQICTSSTIPKLGSRITNAKNAAPGQFPYQVSVELKFPLLKSKHVCGGSIINENYVLTAGHCAKGFTFLLGKMRVKVGQHDLKQSNEYSQIVEVAKRIPHESFPGGLTPKQHDIALLKLRKPLVFNENVQPVQLPEQDSDYSGMAFLSGWGSTAFGFRPKLPQILQFASVPIIEQKECKNFYNGQRGSPGIDETMVCSGPINGSISACVGDSGGPLVQYVEDKPVQIGVVSWGSFPCGAGAPSVYTRVSSYVDWIRKISS